MSKKYTELTRHLAGRDDHEWKASFDEIENILGFRLPASARTHQAWWSNQSRAQSLAWQLAGWKAKNLDVESERITFVYVGSDKDDDAVSADTAEPEIVPAGLTIAQAKAGLAATFDVDPSQIEITIKG